MKDYILRNIEESANAKKRLLEDDGLVAGIESVARACINAYENGNKIITCGNGGSASDALHMVGELVSRYKIERAGIPAIALASNTAALTAIGNDYDYDKVFVKQIEALGRAGDVLFAISTSGNSTNAVLACEEAKRRGVITVGLTGEGGGKLGGICDYCLKMPSCDTPRIQEMHILVIHIICGLIESELYDRGFFDRDR